MYCFHFRMQKSYKLNIVEKRELVLYTMLHIEPFSFLICILFASKGIAGSENFVDAGTAGKNFAFVPYHYFIAIFSVCSDVVILSIFSNNPIMFTDPKVGITDLPSTISML